MSRSGYVDDIDDYLQVGRYRAQISSATRGKRGQEFFRAVVEALDAMPEKRLVRNPISTAANQFGEYEYDSLGDKDRNVCVLGALAMHRGLPVDIDAEDHAKLGETFNIAHQLAAEAMYMNDEYYDRNYTPETRWIKMREWAVSQLKEQKHEHHQVSTALLQQPR